MSENTGNNQDGADFKVVPIIDKRSHNESTEVPANLNDVVDEIENLAEALEKNTKHVARDNSFHNRFWIGVVQGFGAVVGATVLVAIFVYILRSLSHYGILSSANDWIIDLLSKGK